MCRKKKRAFRNKELDMLEGFYLSEETTEFYREANTERKVCTNHDSAFARAKMAGS